MDKESKSLVESFGIVAMFVCILVLFIVIPAFCKAWVFTKIWAWYLVPHFGVSNISILAALGIVILVGLSTGRIGQTKNALKKTETNGWENYKFLFVEGYVRPALVVSIAGLIHLIAKNWDWVNAI